MAQLDLLVVGYLNGLARACAPLDRLIYLIASNHLFKGGVFITLLWWFWFRAGERNQVVRERVIATLLGALIALLMARFLAVMLPFRPRPLHHPGLDFQLPYGMPARTLESCSSFPSDHGTLFFALAIGIWLISRPVGAFAFTYALLFIGLPRIYLGLHYPSDVVVGATIGMGAAWLVNREGIRRRVTRPAMRWLHKAPGSFHAAAFLLCYEIANMFDNLRAIAHFALPILRSIVNLASPM